MPKVVKVARYRKDRELRVRVEGVLELLVVKVARYRKDREPKTKQPKIVRVRDLPINPPNDVFLFCDLCDSQYSAARGDTFLCSEDEPMTCSCDDPPHPLRLVRRVVQYEDIR
jgi:hypothetical protein